MLLVPCVSKLARSWNPLSWILVNHRTTLWEILIPCNIFILQRKQVGPRQMKVMELGSDSAGTRTQGLSS